MSNVLVLEHFVSFGNDHFYPRNDVSENLCKFKNQKSLTIGNVIELQELMGYEIQMYVKSFDEICNPNAPHYS